MNTKTKLPSRRCQAKGCRKNVVRRDGESDRAHLAKKYCSSLCASRSSVWGHSWKPE